MPGGAEHAARQAQEDRKATFLPPNGTKEGGFCQRAQIFLILAFFTLWERRVPEHPRPTQQQNVKLLIEGGQQANKSFITLS